MKRRHHECPEADFGPLFRAPPPPPPTPKDRIAARFEQFHAENPHVYRMLRDLCLKARGLNPGCRIGVKALFERLRWQVRFETRGGAAGEWKLNNNYTALYARMLMEREPELAGIFETRERKAVMK